MELLLNVPWESPVMIEMIGAFSFIGAGYHWQVP